MKVLGAVKKFIAIDFAVGIIVTAVLWRSIGTEGMAAKFCSLAHVEMCDEIEWSEEFE